MHTVIPAKNTAPARGVDRVDRRVLDRTAGLHPASVPRDDQQGIVDADAKPDQYAKNRREAGDREDMAQQPSQRVAHTDRHECGDQRQEGREQRSERKPEHDEGEDDSDRGAARAALGLHLLDVLATQGDLQRRVTRGLRGRDHLLHIGGRESLGLLIEQDGGERHGAVLADLSGTRRIEWAGHRRHVRDLGDLGQHLLRLRLDRRVVQGAAGGVHDDLIRAS
jgi:hypothetical protein